MIIKQIVITLCLLVFIITARAQSCDCTFSQVQNNTVTPCNLTIGTVVTVNSVSGLRNAILQANSTGGNMTILIANGTYQISSTAWYPTIFEDNVVIRSLSGNRDLVILRGGGMKDVSPDVEDGILIIGDNVTIADLTIVEVGNHAIQVSGHHVLIHNVKIQNAYQQMIKGATSAASIDSGIVQCSLMEYPGGIGPNYYIGGIDIHKGNGWIVRDNIYRNIISPAGSLAEHAVHFWNNCANNIVERNLIINCDRGIGFGLGTSANTGGIIRNNMIYNNGLAQFNDVGIALETSPNTKVYNNTVYVNYRNAIEYRWAATTNVDIKNNLTNKSIASRDGGTGTLATNVTNAQASWFVNVASGDLHLVESIFSVVDQGTDLTSIVNEDIDKTLRPQGSSFDIGAHEFTLSQNIQENNRINDNLVIYPNPGNGIFTVKSEIKISEIEITDFLGAVIHAEQINYDQAEINLSKYPKGIYFYKIKNGKEILKTGKIIIQ